MSYVERASQGGKSKIGNKLAVQPASPVGRSAGSGSTRLVFFGTDDFSVPALDGLIKAGYDIGAVVTKPDAPAGRGRQLQSPPVKKVAEEAKVEVWQPLKVADITAKLKKLNPTHGVLASYGKLIPSSILDLFPGGIINIHPSLLPKYRGPSPIEAAILNGDEQTGVSLIKLTEGLDEGPVYAQKVIVLSLPIDRLLLTETLANAGRDLLLEKLPLILDGTLSLKQQDDSQATYTKLLTKADGRINYKDTAKIAERKVRAYLGFPKSYTKLKDVEMVITKAHAVPFDDPEMKPGDFEIVDKLLMIYFSSGYLCVDRLQPVGKAEMAVADFISGYKSKLA